MVIFKQNNLGRKLSTARKGADLRVLEFLKSAPLNEISYREYKYLHVQDSAIRLNEALTGKKVQNRKEIMQFALWVASADESIEKSAKIDRPELGASGLDYVITLWMLEGLSKTYKQYTATRERIGLEVGKFYNNLFGNKPHIEVWSHLAVAMNMIDSIADMRKDVKDGQVPKPNATDILRISWLAIKYSVKTIAKIGIVNSLRFLSIPTICTIKGGFENSEKKERKQKIFPMIYKIEAPVLQSEADANYSSEDISRKVFKYRK